MSGPRQFVLPLPQTVSLGREDYFVSDSNRAAFKAVERWPDWPGGMLAVIGPPGAGKTHLAALHRVRGDDQPIALWPQTARHQVVEDIDRLVGERAAEEALFHAFNRTQGEGGTLLLTARTPIAAWPVQLADLRTRLNTVVAVDLPPPDDPLLTAVLLKLFADRQIAPALATEMAVWLTPRIERSLAEAASIVTALDQRSLAEKRRIDPRLAQDILRQRAAP